MEIAVKYFIVFGGLNIKIDTTKPLLELIEKHILNEYSNLKYEIHNLTGGYKVDHAILSGIALGDRRTNSSFKRAFVTFEEGMKCVEKLVERGIIEIESSQHHLAKKRGDDKVARKLLFTTPFLRFWFAFVSPIYKGIKENNYKEFYTLFENKEAEFGDFVFEELSMEYLRDLYKEDPSVENTMIYLLTGNGYEKLKQEATDLGYERFFRYLKDKTPTRRIENVDKRILELPEFKPLKSKLSAFEYGKLDDKDQSDLDILRYKVFFPFLAGTGVIRDEYSKLISNNKEFWMDVINNRSTYQNEISKIMVEKGFALYEAQIHSSIIQYMSPELSTDDGILSAIFSNGSNLVINMIIAAGRFNPSLSKKFNPLINVNFGKWIKAMILSAQPGFFQDNVAKEFIKYYDALQSTFGNEILPFVEDIKIELIKKSYHNYFAITENRSKLINEDNILLFLDLYGNNDQVIKIILENKFEDLRIFNLHSPPKIEIQKALNEIPVLRDYLIKNYPNALRDVTGYKSEAKPLSKETSEMIDKLSNLASRFDKENKYRLADKITEYMLKF